MIKTRMLIVLAFLLSFAGVAAAADAIDSNSTTLDLAEGIYNAFHGGHYAYAAAIGLILGVALIKRYLSPKIAWLNSDAGGSILVLLGAGSTALAASLAGGGAFTFGLAENAFMVGVAAAGGYAMFKNLIVTPLLKPLAAKAPAWAQPIFQVIFWIFDKEDPTTTAVAAGNAAVAAAPAPGVSAVVGTPPDVK